MAEILKRFLLELEIQFQDWFQKLSLLTNWILLPIDNLFLKEII